MCGIAGFVQKESHTKAWHDDTISAMTGSLHHRGPDSSGTWIDHENGVALGHRVGDRLLARVVAESDPCDEQKERRVNVDADVGDGTESEGPLHFRCRLSGVS